MKKLLVCSCAFDDKRSPISLYLLRNEQAAVVAGVEVKAKELDADILYLLPEGEDVTGLNGQVAHAAPSPVLKNPYAVAQVLDGNLPRPMIQDDYVAVYDDKEVLVITPEDAIACADSKYIAVNGEVKKVALGTALSEVADFAAAKAVLVGGLKGQFYKPSEAAALTVKDCFCTESVTVLPEGTCIVDYCKTLMEETQAASCGKCVLCREGSSQYKQIVAEMTTGKTKAGDMALIKEVGELIQIGAYCPFGQNMPKVIISAMDLFADEFEEHIKKKSCKCGVCYKTAASYYIDPDECIGCGECIDACPEEAIEGKDGFIHMIDQDLCEKCGKCVDSCDEGCIKTADKLPKLPKKRTKVGKW